MTDTSCSDSDVSKSGRDDLAAGSRAFLDNSYSEAAETFKSALDKTSSKSNHKISISQLVLKYALCVALIKCSDYKHITEAVTILLELIESGYANKLPSLYLALGKAYFSLNRFKSALDFIEKGLKTIQSNSKIKQHMWPGLQQPIEETIKENLQKELLSLQKDCKQSHTPDAICKFDQCSKHSSHIIPTQDIYLTDPDFKPFLYIQCSSNCKYAYHNSCWEHIKHDVQEFGRMDEPKDLLGTACLACSKLNNDSVIVEVNLIGSEFGFDKPLFTWLLEEDKCSNIKSRNQVKANTQSPVKGNVKAVSSNGSINKSRGFNHMSVMRTNPAQHVPPAHGYRPFPQTILRPGSSPIFHAGCNMMQSQIRPIVVGPSPVFYCPSPMAQWTRGYPIVTMDYNNNTAFYPQPSLQQQFPATYVEVSVKDAQILSGGTTLMVPVGPSGGPCKIVPPRDIQQTSEEKCSSSGLVEVQKEIRTESSKAAIESVVENFKTLVWKLAGESPSSSAISPTVEKSVNEPSVKKVVQDLQNIVQKLGGDTGNMKKEIPAMNQIPKSVDPYPTSLPSMSQQLLISEGSTFQANPKVSPVEDENYSDQSSLCSSQDDIRSESLDSSKLPKLLDILHQCRKMEFGYLPTEYMNPELQCFGHPFVDSLNFVEPNMIDESDKDEADFVYSYFYSIFEKNGLHRLEDLQERWKSTISDDLGLPETFTNKYSSVSEFLLKSEKFAAIDEFIGTSDLLPDMFSKAQVEIAESVSFLLFSQDPDTKSKDKHFSADTFNNAWKIKLNNNNCDPHTSLHNQSSASADDSGSDHSGECEKPVNIAVSKDNNDNPISSNSKILNSNKPMITPEVNGTFLSTSGCNASSMADVYMSDEDEEIDSSLVIDGVENRKDVDTPLKWSQAITKPVVLSKHSQTEQMVDAEKENLAKSRDTLMKEVSELRYEKGELHQRIESLQFQMENCRATMESRHAFTLKQTQEKHDEKISEKSKELKEILDKYSALEQTVSQLTEKVVEKENDVMKLTSSLQKIQRNHAKEMNNFEQRLQEEKKHKLAESVNQSRYKDQRYIQLWKEFCEFKINKFNQSCNDRINVLSQLKDMVSESVHPTKSEISSIIEKYEDSMISVTQKNAEVNEVFNQLMEKMRNGLEVQLPAVVDVPDSVNMPYPPEGVFDYLRSMIKPKVDEFAVPQNHFLGGSRFYPRPFNGGQQSRENEGFGSVPSSLFGQGHNETPHLWNTMTPSPISFDVNNVVNSQFHQGFGSSNPMMQQSSLNLMPSLTPYPPSSQNPLLSQRTTPSPSLPLSVNGSAFSNASPSGGFSSSLVGLLAAPGTKIPTSNPSQKTLGNTTVTINQPVKNTPAPVNPPATVSPQGAIPKPRVQTATASMTPIVPSKPKPIFKGAKESNYEKLMRNLQKTFPTRTDGELTEALKRARERNNNTLSSLSHSEIVSRVEEILNGFRKQTSMSWEKFGQAAWGTAKTPVVEWEGTEQDECCICMAPMNVKEIYTLECKHAFHKDCIKKWLVQESVCPNCRTHSTMDDEFPPLG